MARPKIDSNKLTNRIITEAEGLLAETQGSRLVMSEVAARVGISQSYVHRFFPTKSDLVRELAARWFALIDAESKVVVALDLPAPARLQLWVLTILRLKRDRYDQDPALYNAYLDLAADHLDLVARHTGALSNDLKSILSQMVPAAHLSDAVTLTEDATALFRLPQNIALFRDKATDERAAAVVNVLKNHFEQSSNSTS